MGWTYNSDLTTNKDRVRFLLQDTNTARQLLQDEEIIWVISTEPNVWAAAAACADMLVAKFRGATSKRVGGLAITYGAEQWERVASKLRARGSMHIGPTAVLTTDDRDAIWDDPSIIRGDFFDGLHEDPNAQRPVRGSDLTEDE